MTENKLFHEPVLKKEILEVLVTEKTKIIFDGTLGLGGHASACLEKYENIELYVGCDLDLQHLGFAQKRLENFSDRVVFENKNFSEFKNIVHKNGWKNPGVILLDLGLCSNQLDDAEKGFAFSKDGPLNMSFGAEAAVECTTIVNDYSLGNLTRVLKDYGEEPRARRIAQKIIEARTHKSLRTTGELRSVIESSVYPQDLKKTLTRVFQALRIETNQELLHLEKILEECVAVLEAGDRIGIISYHSLEDRIVKKRFSDLAKAETRASQFSLHEEVAPAKFKMLTKKPIIPSEEEIEKNPRARSAKLRILERQ